MQQPNQNGVYAAEIVDQMARVGHSYANIEIAQCDDGLYRYAFNCMYSLGGFCGPITKHTMGFESLDALRNEALAALIGRFPKPFASDPTSVHAELREMKQQLENHFRQPSLF